MAILREIATDNRVPLEPEHVVGRALTCALRLDYGYVSAQHAIIRHDGQGWVIRDLASRNGTWLDGRRIPPGQEQRLRRGSELAFGVPDARWDLADDAPPCAMVVPLDGTPPVLVEGDLIALPSAEEPRVTIYRGVAGAWMLEEGDAPGIPLRDWAVFHCAGRAWRFSCTSDVRATTRAGAAPTDVHLRDLTFELTVSLDEEHVDVRARAGDRVIELGERTHHYLLLTLARARLADAHAGTIDTACGWVDVDMLCRDSKTGRGQVGVDVFRIRKRLLEHGVVDATGIVERRPGQLRIGTAKTVVTRQ